MKTSLLFLFLFTSITFSQIAISNFEYEVENGTEQISNKLEYQLKENLSRIFFVVQRDFSDIQNELQIQEIREYFQKQIDVSFTPASYLIKGYVYQSKNFNSLFDLKIEIINLQTSVVSTLSQNYLAESNLVLISEYISQYIKNIVPAIYKINSFVDKNTISINYGSDRSAQDGDELELVSAQKDEVLGEIIVDKVYSTSSNCDFDLENDFIDFNEMTYREFYSRTKIEKDKAEKFRIKLAELRSERAEGIVREKEEIEIENETQKFKPNDWIVISMQNIYFSSDSLGKYSDKSSFSPLVLGLQINWAKADTRFFIKGKFSLSSEINSFNDDHKESLFYFQAGCGIQQRFSIFDFIYPGLAFGVNYMYSSVEYKNIILNQNINKTFRGLDIEFNANLTFRIGTFGIYGEAGYHLIPVLKNEDKTDWKTSGYSFATGISFFFK